MSFFECEFPRSISFKATGGPSASTFVVGVESGNEQRNRNWSGFRRRYVVSLITPAGRDGDRQVFAEQLEQFFMLVGGKADGFRFYDHLRSRALAQTLGTIDSTHYQIQRSLSLGGRTYVQPITKPITSSVVDFTGAALANSVQVYVGGSPVTPSSISHTTGIVTFASPPGGAVTADFSYHVPVRFDTDDCQIQIEESDVADGKPVISWNSLSLVEVLPPNY